MQRRLVALLGGTLLIPAGCNTPESVADFCAQSQTALAASVPVFGDLGESCLRVKTLAKGIGSFEVVESDPGCAAIAQKGEASIAAVKILEEYFGALHSLAKFGTAKTGADAKELAAAAAGVGGAGTDAQAAIGSIAQFLTTAATGAYQMKSLNRDIKQVNGNVSAVTEALIHILQENYLHQELTDEGNKLTAHYKDFALAHPDGQTAILLEERWQADRARLLSRRAAAEEAIEALRSMQAGVAALAGQVGSLKAREIPGLLDPYITQLETLIPEMQKAVGAGWKGEA